jgi:hypothetical protein
MHISFGENTSRVRARKDEPLGHMMARGLLTYDVLFFIEIGSRRVCLGGITRHPDADWMEQVARNATMQDSGYLNGRRYLLHDRDQKFCREFGETLAAGGVKCLPLPARSPNLNAYRNVGYVR